ncbi:putative glycoside hydrolase [Nocardioides sp.]|uniref:putative glycoside hydrolase n=1 Tax=Nocardioides sp. TaxID=35761 RepID=UPI003783B7B0
MRAPVAVLLAVAALVVAPTTPASAAARPHVPGTGVVALDWGDLDKTPDAAAGDYVVMQSWEYPRIPAYRAAHPHVRILMYKDVSATVDRPHETGLYPTGVSYADADQHHPEWFLTDAHGTRLEWADYPGLHPMDVGNRGYQRAWLRGVLRELRAHDWDGVVLDDTLTSLSHPVVDDLRSTRIPDDATMYRATQSFLSRVGPGLMAAGFLAISNVTVQWNTWSSVLSAWAPYVSGWEDEYFVKWGQDTGSRFVGADWEWKMRLAAWCAAHRVPLLAVTYSSASDAAAQTYHRATWLLTWNGRTGASVFVPSELRASHWQPRATVDLGRPAGPRVRHADGTWTRRYAGGLVVVNPGATSRLVALERDYARLDGTRVRELRLGPASAALLRRLPRAG